MVLIKIDPKLHERLRYISIKTRRPVSDLIEEATEKEYNAEKIDLALLNQAADLTRETIDKIISEFSGSKAELDIRIAEVLGTSIRTARRYRSHIT